MSQSRVDAIVAAAKKLDGKAPARDGFRITVRPSSFESDGRGNYEKGDIVRCVRVGKFNMTIHHLEALFKFFGVWDKVSDAALAKALAANIGDD